MAALNDWAYYNSLRQLRFVRATRWVQSDTVHRETLFCLQGQWHLYQEKGIVVVSFSAREATARSLVDAQLWTSDEFDTS